jgi:phospholipase C
LAISATDRDPSIRPTPISRRPLISLTLHEDGPRRIHEFGGQWDHVAPPGQGGAGGPHDQWGPGTRIPALIISPFLHGNFVVDHTQYDTTSIVATIERRYGLEPLSSRDAAVNDLGNVFSAKQFNQR